MYSKLALRNVKKSYRDFFIYFITLTFSVALFYVFTSFESQSEIINLDASQGSTVATLIQIMNVMSYIVAGVFAFLILYANNFLIKRRKKELGMYTMLGMPKRIISRILVYETLYIGFFSLITGMVLGIILSQGTAVLSAKLLSVTMDYKIIFSIEAFLKTLLCFIGIFVIVIVFNGLNLKRYQLIDLLKASRQNEIARVKTTWTSIGMLLISFVLIGVAYALALEPLNFIKYMPLIIVVGAAGTFALFLALSGFMLKFMQSNKSIYYKDLNVFSMRQVSAKISSTYKMMAVISLMLLIAIGSLATSFNLNHVLGSNLTKSTPHDVSVMVRGQEPHDISENFKELKFVSSLEHMRMFDIGLYTNSFLDIESEYGYQSVVFIPLEDFNQARKNDGLSPLMLDKNSAYIQAQGSVAIKEFGLITEAEIVNKGIDLGGTHLETISGFSDPTVRLMNGGDTGNVIVVVNDSFVPYLEDHQDSVDGWSQSVHSYNLRIAGSQSEAVDALQEITTSELPNNLVFTLSTEDVTASMRGIILLFTYVGLYLGAVFLLSSVVVLALQQLSEASDNQKRYEVLAKIGASEKQIKHSMIRQISIYFGFPLVIALVHSAVGIYAMNETLRLAGLAATTMIPAILTTLSILIIYIIYFIITVSGSKAIIFEKNR